MIDSTDYRIIVHMKPHIHDNPTRPYFWFIRQGEDDPCQANMGFGWSETPAQAFKNACDYLETHLK